MEHSADEGLVVGPQIMFGFDTNGRCALSTGPGLAQLGLRPGELVGRDLFALYENDPEAVEHMRRAISGESFVIERQFGERRLSVFYETVRDGDGKVTGVVGVTTDVTEQRRIEAAERASRNRSLLLADLSVALNREVADVNELLHVAARSLTEAVADIGVAWLCVPHGKWLEPRAVWYADAGAPSHTWSPEAVSKAIHLEVADLDGLSSPEPLDLRAVAGPGSPHAELLTPLVGDAAATGTGLRVPLRSRGLLIGVVDLVRLAGGEPFGAEDLGLIVDLGDRCALVLDNALLLLAERSAREELVKFQALADASDNMIAISDNQDQITYLNPRVRAYGIGASGLDVWKTLAVHVAEEKAVELRSALDTAGRWSGDLTLVVAGAEVTTRVEAFHLSHTETGAPLGTAWIGQDVTDIRATEAALRAANSDLKEFKALVEASPDFIAIASLDGTVKYVNPQGRQMIGMDSDVDVTTTTISDYLTPEGLAASVEIEQPAVIAHGHWEGESTLRNHRGPAIPVAIASFLMRDSETGEPFALATVQRDITDRLTAETALRELADQREALLSRLVDAQDAERAQIAADVHDDPVQALAAVDLRLGVLKRRLRERAPDLLEALDPVQSSITGATDRLRALLFDLEPPDLRQGLTGALCRAAEEIFDGTATRWTVEGEREPDVPDPTRAIGYRIAKEALINIRKHAGAANVWVVVDRADGGLQLTVGDDGVGLVAEPLESSPGHRGVFNMQDRATVAGGRCTVASRPGGGTLVAAWLPAGPPTE